MEKIGIRTEMGIAFVDVCDVPLELYKNFFDFEVDYKKLWQLKTAVTSLPIETLDWMMDIPLWDSNGKPFAICPRDVVQQPNMHLSHYNRSMNVDLRFPIEICFNKGRYLILDGMHRLTRLYLEGREKTSEVEVRVHSYSSILACMDMECTPESIKKKYLLRANSLRDEFHSSDPSPEVERKDTFMGRYYERKLGLG